SEEADVIILNSCTVKNPSENSLMRELEKYKDSYKIVIVAGCVAQADPEKLGGYPLIGTNQFDQIVEVVEEALNENIVCNLSQEDTPSLKAPKVRENPVVEIIPICRGCLGNCSYCKTKAARGELVSYPIEDIKLRVRRALMEGAKEIWLTAQDCGCYGFDLNTNLAKLLEELVTIDRYFKIRIGMINPNHLLKIKDELLKVFSNEKIFKFLHIPLQSGNDEILKAMKRKYSMEDFLNLVKEFRQHFPRITLATDVIVGFPGESEEQHWETLNLIRRISPDVLHISRFWARPKTPAAKMKNQIRGDEIKRRSGVLAEIFKNIAHMQNEKWLTWEGEILIDDQGTEPGQMIGRNPSYKQVLVMGDFELGQRVKVKIGGVKDWDLRGRVI
ncbi:tRNA (N(6)-L-threonylcarbamoyladenosine(37)-C(2))-methylthiotransferase, partial [Candidatus Woesearchaeota archaeon]|nr:tRNA (N(6)-L-threonylcarbamoyladenosine(37)-C(2))-methylthiotransferase [Candidatus Woesearchaeota archaeon]